jgi:hypothetical protein
MKPFKTNLKSTLLILCSTILVFQSCMKDKLDFENVSNRIEYNPKFSAPLIKGSFSIEDIIGEDAEDSVIIFRGEEVILVLNTDSVYTFVVSDIVDIPDQSPDVYSIPEDPVPIDIPIFTSQDYTIDQMEEYEITLENNIRMDSLYLHSGYLDMNIASTFNIESILTINIPAITIDGQEFSEDVPLSTREYGEFDTVVTFPLAGAVLIPDYTYSNSSYVNIYFTITMSVEAGDTIKAGSYAEVDFNITGLNDFITLFGYAGDYSFNQDTVMDIDLGILNGVSGEFAITNPTIKINYAHSFGLPVGVDIDIKGYFEDGDSVILSPDTEIIDASADYLNPDVEGSVVIDKTKVSNIDDLLVFPPPQSIGYDLSVYANPDGDTTAKNFVSYDSELLIGLDVEIPLEFRANLQFRDTLKFDLNSDTTEEIDYIEYARLFYIFRNEFPINIDASLILYDSITDTNIDTLSLNENGDTYFLNAAPVDDQGETILEEVREFEGEIDIEEDMAYKLFNDANKLIIIGKFTSYDPGNVSSVKILRSYKLDFKFGLDAKINYIQEPE